MILGLGIDICKIARIKNTPNFEAFAQRVLTKAEYEKMKLLSNQANFLAKRWSAKEAFAKASGLGLYKLGFQNIEIFNEKSGKPCVKLTDYAENKLYEIFNLKNLKINLSITDEIEYAASVVIIEAN